MNKENPIVVSLFDGMSCMRITLEKMGVTPGKYFASEIDPHANKEVAANWPDTIQLGDVTKWREWDLDWSKVDLLVGGSPCQGFSFAGKQAGTKANLNGVDFIIETREQYLQAKADGATFYSQSHLFWEYVLCLDYVKEQSPNLKFMLENVKMKKCFLDMITEALGVEPVFINSALVSAQNRQRYYWANWKITQPEDRGILLADILESGVVDRYKSHCLDANYFKGGNLESYFGKNRRQLVFVNSLDDITSYRKLTVVECCRLQGVPDDYFKVSSNTQAYKMLGNGWQCDTIEHIFNCLFSIKG